MSLLRHSADGPLDGGMVVLQHCRWKFSTQRNCVTDRQTDKETNRRTDRITTAKTALAYLRRAVITSETWPLLNGKTQHESKRLQFRQKCHESRVPLSKVKQLQTSHVYGLPYLLSSLPVSEINS